MIFSLLTHPFDTHISASIDLNAGPGYSNYLWSNSQSSQNITVTGDGLYCVTITDFNGCVGSDCAFVQFAVGINAGEKEKLISIFYLYYCPQVCLTH